MIASKGFVINGQQSEWGIIRAGVPQGSVLGPLFFLLYINDLVHEVQHCNIRFFADDTCLFIEVDNRDQTVHLVNADLERIHKWSEKWLVSFSPQKTKSLIISNKLDKNLNPPVSFNNTAVAEVSSHRYLGLILASNLKWDIHIDDLVTKAKKRLNMMLPLKHRVDRKTLETIYTSFVRPVIEYAIAVWGGTYDTTRTKLEQINVSAMRIISGATSNSSTTKLYQETSLETIVERRDQATLKLFYKIKSGIAPNYLHELIPPTRGEAVTYPLRNNRSIQPPFARLETMKRSFIPTAIRLWNLLPNNIRDTDNLS